MGLEWFRAYGWLGFLTVGLELGFFSVKRFFLARVYVRVSYGYVGFRFFLGLESFRAYGWLGFLTVGLGLGFFSV